MSSQSISIFFFTEGLVKKEEILEVMYLNFTVLPLPWYYVGDALVFTAIYLWHAVKRFEFYNISMFCICDICGFGVSNVRSLSLNGWL